MSVLDTAPHIPTCTACGEKPRSAEDVKEIDGHLHCPDCANELRTIRPGMRVRLVEPTLWAAGKVPVGAVGTVYLRDERQPCVKWDRYTARLDYHFAIAFEASAPLPDFLEPIND